MPLYEYQCESCQHRFEKIRKFSDPPLDACPVCNGPVRKLPSSPAIQFKGSGWYITDYAKKSSTDSGGGGKDKSDSGGRDKADSGSSSESGGKSDSGDSKSADAKSTEAKSSETKSSDSGSGDSKSPSTPGTTAKT